MSAPDWTDAVRAERERVAAGELLPAVECAGRPLRDVSADALAALAAGNQPPAIFRRSGALCRVRRDEDDRPLIDRLGEPELRGHLARTANYVRPGKNGPVATSPPRDVVQDVLALGTWPDFPPLVGVLEAPALRPDGTVIAAAGYDAATRLILAPTTTCALPAIPDAPTAAQRSEARELLCEAVRDFPFADPASRANALALLLTPCLRPAIPGPVPLAMIDATKAGSGKGLLANLVSVIHSGRPAAVLAAPTREEEWAKTLFSALAAGRTLVLFDEAADLRSPALAAVLTAETFEGRILGRSETVQLPQRATWAAAGNNIRLGGDLARRCYWIRLDAKTARPWERSGFQHPDLLGWAARRRYDLLGAALTLARAWFADGTPKADAPALGGFQAWADTLAGILATAGIPGFLGNLTSLYDAADEEAAQWEAFLSAWSAEHHDTPLTVADLAAAIDNGGTLRDTLPDDLAAALGKSPASFKSKLGRALGKRDQTRYGDTGLRVERAHQDARSTAWSWRVTRDNTPAGVQGSQGSITPAHAGENFTRDNGHNTPATPATPAQGTPA